MELETIEELLEGKEMTAKIKYSINRELAKELSKLGILKTITRSRIVKQIQEKYDELGIDDVSTIAKKWFGLEVDRHYLERRDEIEKVSFWMIRNSSKGVILEAFQRLQNDEEEWEVVSDRWGIEPERNYRGKYRQLSVTKITKDIKNQLMRLKPNEISEPMKIGKYYSILKLEKWENVDLNEDMRRILEKELYEEWINKQTNMAIAKILKGNEDEEN